LVADAYGAVPGAAKGEKCAIVVLGGELLAGIKREIQNGPMRTQTAHSARGPWKPGPGSCAGFVGQDASRYIGAADCRPKPWRREEASGLARVPAPTPVPSPERDKAGFPFMLPVAARGTSQVRAFWNDRLVNWADPRSATDAPSGSLLLLCMSSASRKRVLGTRTDVGVRRTKWLLHRRGQQWHGGEAAAV
jgi:hypothetical protein